MTIQIRPEPLPRLAGWAAFGVLAAFAAVGATRRWDDRPALAIAGLAVTLGFGAVALFGRPAWLVPGVVAASAGTVLLANATASNIAWFALPLFAAWCALAAPLLATLAYAGAAIVLIGCEWAFTVQDPGWTAWIGGTAFSAVATLFARRQRDLVEQLRAAQAGLAQRAQAEERNRIARELHDVIAHSLTVSLLHVASARLALDEDRDAAERALAEAERLGRQSLDEVRHAVGLLRDAGADPTTPLPGSLDVPALLERFRDAGADVRASVAGDLAALPATVGLATYRILQEALTNAAKHAPRTSTTVQLSVDPDAVRLCVDSAGEPRRGSGLGLLGMRERAESLGGRCEAGPGGSGWLVRAELPL